jgi:coenzyme F420-reducing hydrogenase alpha subunit
MKAANTSGRPPAPCVRPASPPDRAEEDGQRACPAARRAGDPSVQRSRLGGFHRTPRRQELAPLAERLERAREFASEVVRFAAALDFPERRLGCECVALVQPAGYGMVRGGSSPTLGLGIAAEQYEEHFVEEQVPHSTALLSRLRERGAYLVGPAGTLLARLRVARAAGA